MADNFEHRRIVLLLDGVSEDGARLANSLIQAGYEIDVVNLQKPGCMDRDVLSVPEYILGYKKEKRRPLYYNEVKIPQDWTLHYGNREKGAITYLQEKKGEIHYYDCEKKFLVASVDWLDASGNVRMTEHYDYSGRMVAKTIYDGDGKAVSKTWYDESQREGLVEQYEPGVIHYLLDGESRFFDSFTDVLSFYLTMHGRQVERIFINSLSVPFFFLRRLQGVIDDNVLFWQEGAREDIPGNMRQILEGQTNIGRICVQYPDAYQRFLELGIHEGMVQKLGFIYEAEKENKGNKEALICTNSDQLAGITEFIESLPEMHFHIAAITSMSERLMNLGTYPNVTLYPGIRREELNQLFIRCDYYLDINYGKEIADAVETAFLHNLLILGFLDTVHNRRYVADENLYGQEERNQFLLEFRQIVNHTEERKMRLMRQQNKVSMESSSTYHACLDNKS